MMDGFLQNCTIEVIDDFENEYSKISSNKKIVIIEKIVNWLSNFSRY